MQHGGPGRTQGKRIWQHVAGRLRAGGALNGLYLHVRHVDKPALNLYRKYGYEVDGEDIGLVRLLGMDQRFLMKKYLTAKED